MYFNLKGGISSLKFAYANTEKECSKGTLRSLGKKNFFTVQTSFDSRILQIPE